MDFPLLLQHVKNFITDADHKDSVFTKVLAMDEKVLNAFNALTLAQRHELFYVLLSAQPDPDDDTFERIVVKLLEILGNDYFSEVAAFGKVPKNRLNLLKKFPDGSGIVHPPDSSFLSAIDHVINNAPLSDYMQDSYMEQDSDQTHSILLIKKLIDHKIDVRNNCAIHCVDNFPEKRILLKTTLHFAMDVGFDAAVTLLIHAQAHLNLHPWAPSALEYAIWLNRADYVAALCSFDLDYVRQTLQRPPLLEKHDTLFQLCEDNKNIIEILHTYGLGDFEPLTIAPDFSRNQKSLQFSARPAAANPSFPALNISGYDTDIEVDTGLTTDSDIGDSEVEPHLEPFEEKSESKPTRRISPMQ